jgi:hypothetical protein
VTGGGNKGGCGRELHSRSLSGDPCAASVVPHSVRHTKRAAAEVRPQPAISGCRRRGSGTTARYGWGCMASAGRREEAGDGHQGASTLRIVNQPSIGVWHAMRSHVEGCKPSLKP